ncbi:5-deoxy-glucuronate isomerase [Streptomyces yunnanensis]|uniref:5-deoxy-glucuronate isomerase n=1 Tax=Streptomyces yunnanensis TaxID=156453 RepID=UPI003B82FB27
MSAEFADTADVTGTAERTGVAGTAGTGDGTDAARAVDGGGVAAPAPVAGGGFHLVAGRGADGPYALDVSPEKAGWGYSSLRILELPPGGQHTFATADSEWIVLPLSGGCTVRADASADGAGDAGVPAGGTFELAGRESVFSGVTDFAYVPRDAQVRIESRAGGRFALTGARCERRLPARYGAASDVPVELRGTGSCSRQVNNFGAAGVFECDRLIAVEVLTPGGNWSSYPPHKHDECRPGEESELEEIYYFEIAAAHGTEGLGYQRVTPSGRGRGTDVLAEVRNGDAVLIPDGWHGPSIAAPGHDMYYLNVMAGPGEKREWLICDHPDHGWIRATWPQQPVDPRLPLYQAPAGDPR